MESKAITPARVPAMKIRQPQCRDVFTDMEVSHKAKEKTANQANAAPRVPLSLARACPLVKSEGMCHDYDMGVMAGDYDMGVTIQKERQVNTRPLHHAISTSHAL